MYVNDLEYGVSSIHYKFHVTNCSMLETPY